MADLDRLLREQNPEPGQPRVPVPQYQRVDGLGFERVTGRHGGAHAVLLGPDGQPISSSNRLPVEVTGDVGITGTAAGNLQIIADNQGRLYGSPDGGLTWKAVKVNSGGQLELAQDVVIDNVTVNVGAEVKVNNTPEDPVNVQLSGTIQPQWQERIPVFSAGKYTQNQSLVVERPAYAKGVILVVKVSGVSGTFGTEEGYATRVRGYWGTSVTTIMDVIYPHNHYTSERLRSTGWSATMIYPQALGDIKLYSSTQNALLHREEMLLGSHVRFELDIKGTFEADEGITVRDGFAYWLS